MIRVIIIIIINWGWELGNQLSVTSSRCLFSSHLDLNPMEGKDKRKDGERIEEDSFSLLSGVRHDVPNSLGVSREVREESWLLVKKKRKTTKWKVGLQGER